MKIEIPSSCPSCGTHLLNINGQLFCTNKVDCPAQSSKLVENFCSKMKIKGFGPATIEKLEISTISELYHLSMYELTEAVGEKVATKLEAELNEKLRSTVDFASVLGSLSITLIGQVAASKIASKYNSFEDAKADGKAGQNLLAWKDSVVGQDVMTLPWKFGGAQAKAVTTVDAKTLGIDVCITGSLEDFPNRTEATKYLEQLGFSVKKDVTKTVQYLICEDESKIGSSSYKKAQSRGIPILTIKTLVQETL
jgi:NAD-dependent DNA ligase